MVSCHLLSSLSSVSVVVTCLSFRDYWEMSVPRCQGSHTPLDFPAHPCLIDIAFSQRPVLGAVFKPRVLCRALVPHRGRLVTSGVSFGDHNEGSRCVGCYQHLVGEPRVPLSVQRSPHNGVIWSMVKAVPGVRNLDLGIPIQARSFWRS